MIAGESEKDRARAAAVAGVPQAVLGAALTGPQVCGQRIGVSVTGQVGQDGRPRGCGLEGECLSGAADADEGGPLWSWTQFHRPDTPHCGTGEPHRLGVLLF
ncbi:hypothetical protein GCM10023100_78510 [Actinocorallia cavernae]|uniref:Uncharacterized protein n=2 Tax=Actinomycetes TaxID=1760 RepID=A0ABP8T8A7_9ACTN